MSTIHLNLVSVVEDMMAGGNWNIGHPEQSRGVLIREILHGANMIHPLNAMFRNAPLFLCQDDWDAKCQRIDGYGTGPFKAPFDYTIFELVIGTIRVFCLMDAADSVEPSCAVLAVHPDGFLMPYTTFFLVEGEWRRSAARPYGANQLIEIISRQIKAMSVLLEAGAVEANEQVISTRLNQKRLKSGKPALPNYYILTLRTRLREAGASKPYQGVVRQHFRRGHWMRRKGVRVWRKWALVGNPDLGFVSKDYRIGTLS
ncbi:MAG: hypothetical protein CMJ43_00815 [Phyllobacteriaceae bacterium]|nr:hypothetical protein [Phyllobacteriaceae bacterium]